MPYKILDSRIDELEKKLKSIEKKCKKYGNDFTYSRVGEVVEDIGTEDKPFYANFILIEVSGMAKINGWRYVATLVCGKDGNLIRQYDKEIVIPDYYRHSKNVCDHCHSNRFRNELFIIYNDDTQEFKQVGKSCLKSYTNGLSAEYVSSYLEMMQLFNREEEDEYETIRNSGYRSYYLTDDVLLYAYAITKKYGYSKSENIDSTKSRVLSSLITFDENEAETYSSEAKDFINNLKKHFLEVDDNSSYFHNVKLLLQSEYIMPKNVGFLACLPFMYGVELGKIEKIQKQKNLDGQSSFFGEIGKRYKDVKMSLKVLTSYETIYGYTFIYKMVDDNMNVFIWKTTKGFDEGEYMVTFTVKEFAEYKGTKQTEITRCAIKK